MNRYKMELDHIIVPEGAVESLMERANTPRKKKGWLRPAAAAGLLPRQAKGNAARAMPRPRQAIEAFSRRQTVRDRAARASPQAG